jgi:hypothetical protein
VLTSAIDGLQAQASKRPVLGGADERGRPPASTGHDFPQQAVTQQPRFPRAMVGAGDSFPRDALFFERGLITMEDRKGMERKAGGTYGVPEAEYRGLIG